MYIVHYIQAQKRTLINNFTNKKDNVLSTLSFLFYIVSKAISF